MRSHCSFNNDIGVIALNCYGDCAPVVLKTLKGVCQGCSNVQVGPFNQNNIFFIFRIICAPGPELSYQ